MSELHEIKMNVEAEYDKYRACTDEGNRYDTSYLFELLSIYLKLAAKSLVRTNSYINEYDVEDIVNDALMDIFEKELSNFQKKEALFTTFCYAIVKNKIRNWYRKNMRTCLDTGENIDNFSEQKVGQEYGKDNVSSPESQVIRREQQLEAICFLKKYIQTLMNWNCPSYRTVACCFSLILFHRYFPESRKKASPKWAFDELGEVTVKNGANRFEMELNQWMPTAELLWNKGFERNMEKRHGYKQIGELIFGAHFKEKDFSNWTERTSREVKAYLVGEEVKADAAFEL